MVSASPQTFATSEPGYVCVSYTSVGKNLMVGVLPMIPQMPPDLQPDGRVIMRGASVDDVVTAFDAFFQITRKPLSEHAKFSGRVGKVRPSPLECCFYIIG